MSTKHSFAVSGMRCAACAVVVEQSACACAGVCSASVDLSTGTLEVEGDFGGASPASIAATLSGAVRAHGYEVRDAASGPAWRPRWSEFRVALPVAAAIFAGFVALQRLGLVNLLGGGELSFGAAFLVGVVASLSSCLAVVGGLVLSVSAAYSKAGERFWPQAAFHTSRIAAFFLLGGLVGAAGSVLAPGPTGSAILGVVVALAMAALGLNLLDVFPWARRFEVHVPRRLAAGATRAGGRAGFLAPAVLGAVTFVLPCGFTQSMQVYALSTGTFFGGATAMVAFALGTLPVLAAASLAPSVRRLPTGPLFKVAGLLAISFAVVNLLGSLAAFGLIPPVLNF
jgi:sulfite exporter TauE/SafE/copper chaperone CopZ